MRVNIVGFLVVLLFSHLGICEPKIGDSVTYTGFGVGPGGKSIPIHKIQRLKDFNAEKAAFVLEETWVQEGLPAQVTTKLVPSSFLSSTESGAWVTAHCEKEIGGKLQDVVVKAGTFTVCHNDSHFGNFTDSGSVPINGIVKQYIAGWSLELESFNFSK